MMSERRKWRARIPLYLNGSLGDEQRHAFEKILEENPQLRREVEEFAKIHDLYADFQQQMPPPSERVFRRVEAAIRTQEQAPVAKPAAQPFRRLGKTLTGLFTAPRLSWALVAVQLVIIVVLVAGRGQTPVFRTLTSTPQAVHPAAAVQVVFQAHAAEAQIRKMLLAIGASIADGPTAEGLYTLRLADKTNIKQALQRLRQSPLVRFAGRVY